MSFKFPWTIGPFPRSKVSIPTIEIQKDSSLALVVLNEEPLRDMFIGPETHSAGPFEIEALIVRHKSDDYRFYMRGTDAGLISCSDDHPFIRLMKDSGDVLFAQVGVKLDPDESFSVTLDLFQDFQRPEPKMLNYLDFSSEDTSLISTTIQDRWLEEFCPNPDCTEGEYDSTHLPSQVMLVCEEYQTGIEFLNIYDHERLFSSIRRADANDLFEKVKSGGSKVWSSLTVKHDENGSRKLVFVNYPNIPDVSKHIASAVEDAESYAESLMDQALYRGTE
ncbi:MAG: hypothetical protein RL389_330 [Actinomycetota bacterium]|jgi:hypothetical protein